MREIELTRGKVALVDDKDFEWLSQWKWHWHTNKSGHGYPARNRKRSEVREDGLNMILMHYELLPYKEGFLRDHKNRDTLDNRRKNLRYVTPGQNRSNRSVNKTTCSSRFKGVWRCGKKWRAVIKEEGTLRHLGIFTTARKAALAYDEEARKLFGEHAGTNF